MLQLFYTICNVLLCVCNSETYQQGHTRSHIYKQSKESAAAVPTTQSVYYSPVKAVRHLLSWPSTNTIKLILLHYYDYYCSTYYGDYIVKSQLMLKARTLEQATTASRSTTLQLPPPSPRRGHTTIAALIIKKCYV